MNKNSPVNDNDWYPVPFSVKDFPFAIATTVDLAVRSKYYHFHPFAMEFQYIRSGKGFYFINDKSNTFKDKSIFIIHGRDIHTYIKGKNPSRVNKTTLYFKKSFFKDSLSHQPFIKSIFDCNKNFPHQICFSEKEADDIELILHMLEKEWERKGENFREVIKSLLTTFLVLIKRSMSNKEKNISSLKEHNPIIDEVLDYIDKHFKEHITLPDLSKQVGYSSYHISRLFKKFTGLSFRELVDNKRVIEAKRILETDNSKKVISIAYEVGFSDLSAFNRNFKRLTSTIPSLYRKICAPINK
ncbi:MAG: AraC family transcriptional regulator [Elusimicrobia bacterium]|nr:AraC family transcriptional regulator [Elusimicrobiota bacterium]